MLFRCMWKSPQIFIKNTIKITISLTITVLSCRQGQSTSKIEIQLASIVHRQTLLSNDWFALLP